MYGEAPRQQPYSQAGTPTFYQQKEALGVLAQDLDGRLHHFGEGRVRHVVPVQLVLQIPWLKET